MNTKIINKSCAICNKKFDADNYKVKFCSIECRKKGRAIINAKASIKYARKQSGVLEKYVGILRENGYLVVPQGRFNQ